MYVRSLSCHLLLCAALYAFNGFGLVYADKLRICIVESIFTAKTINKTCPNLEMAPFQCVVARDRFECIRRLAAGDADATVLQPEDLLAVSMYNEYDFLVTHQLRLFFDAEHQFEMVALVRKNIGTLASVQGKRFCHAGFGTTDTYTQAISMYFENWILLKRCDPKMTLLENRLARLNESFEKACIAGPWIADAAFDAKLKSKYTNLCALCDNPTSCSIDDKYHGRDGAILCLTDNVGDIAWVRLEDVVEYFRLTENNREDYSYLCPTSLTKPITTEKPCVWLRQPWPVVVARSQMAEKVAQMIDLTENSRTLWKSTLQDLLVAYHSTLVKMESLTPSKDYLQKSLGFLSASNRANCRPSRRVRWCVSSTIEDQKCRWLRDVSFSYGLEPTISCILESNRVSCLQGIRDQRADIFVSVPEERVQVSKKGLKPIMQVTPNKNDDLDRLVAIVKKSSTYKTLRDLKGAKACFTRYESIGWNSFVNVMRNISKEDWDCSDIKAVANFFGDSCVPGLPTTEKNIPHNLYSLCNQDVSAVNDISTMSCLKSDLADVVFVTLRNVRKEFDILSEGSSDVANKSYKILCMDERLSEKEEACSLTWTTLAAIVAHENITDLRRNEIYSILLGMDQLFGAKPPGYTSAFSLYGTYDDNRNIIFPEGAQHLELEVSQKQGIRNYDDIVEDIIKHPACSSARNWNLCFYQINLLGSLILAVIFILN